MESISTLQGYNIRLRRGPISGANFWARRQYFEAFRARHLPSVGEIPVSGAIIDAGCFTGSKTQSLIDCYRGRTIRGIDINNGALEVARSNFPSTEVSFEQGDIRNLQQKVSDAAMVFCSQVFHHLEKDDRLRALGAIFESLQDDGKMVISDTFLDLNNRLYRLMVAFYQRIAKCPYAIVMPENIIEEAQSSGFQLVKTHHTIPGATIGKKFGMYPSSMLTFVK